MEALMAWLTANGLEVIAVVIAAILAYVNRDKIKGVFNKGSGDVADVKTAVGNDLSILKSQFSAFATALHTKAVTSLPARQAICDIIIMFDAASDSLGEEDRKASKEACKSLLVIWGARPITPATPIPAPSPSVLS